MCCGNRAAGGRRSPESASGARRRRRWARVALPRARIAVRCRSLRKGDLEVLLAIAAVDPQCRRNQDLGPFAGHEGPTGPDVERGALPPPGWTQGQTAKGEPLEPGRAIACQAEAPTLVGWLSQRTDRQGLAPCDQPPAEEGGGQNHQDDQQGADDQPLAGEQQAMHGEGLRRGSGRRQRPRQRW